MSNPASAASAGGTARVSWVLTIPVIVALVGGLAVGVGEYVARREEVVVHDPGTNAITAHVVLAAVLAAIVGIRALRSSTSPDVLAPIRPAAATRVRATARGAFRSVHGALRAVASVPIAALMLFLVFRMGMQVTAGAAPAFVTNAWGGPTAIGAFLAHGLDAAAVTAVCALLMDRLLVPVRRRPR